MIATVLGFKYLVMLPSTPIHIVVIARHATTTRSGDPTSGAPIIKLSGKIRQSN